ncbi:MAG: S41 family peptidase [Phycisphaerales bacterium]|nr:MAG: S41 family peptidase [Phycisphaerales bacterium]
MLRQNVVWLAVFVVIATMLLRLPPMIAQQESVLNVYGPLVEADALARKYYVAPIESRRLVDGAIRGMMLELDPYSAYIAPDELPAFRRHHSGDYSGVGLELAVRGGEVRVISPIDDSPAARAGILPGDTILAIDRHDVEYMSESAVNSLLAGPLGSRVSIRLRHAGQGQEEIIHVTRGPVSLVSVKGLRRRPNGDWDYLIDAEKRIGYIRVSSFRENTMGEFNHALNTALGQGATRLILDLRFNPGGLTHEAIAMVDRFVDHGVILKIVNRRQSIEEYHATEHGTLKDVPLTVLINRATASSAEIVAGALQDLDRATIVGERSFGKGSVQHLIPLEKHDGAIKLTVAFYQLPDGRIIHRDASGHGDDQWGIVPDILVPLSAEEFDTIVRTRVKPDRSFPTGGTVAAPPHVELDQDRQLREAISILRGASSSAPRGDS